MNTFGGLRATIDHLFVPVLTHAYGVPAERTNRGFVATTTFPLDAAAHGFRVLVERAGGFEVTVTCPAIGTQPRISATGCGPTWVTALVECRVDLMSRLDRAEARWQKHYRVEEA